MSTGKRVEEIRRRHEAANSGDPAFRDSYVGATGDVRYLLDRINALEQRNRELVEALGWTLSDAEAAVRFAPHTYEHQIALSNMRSTLGSVRRLFNNTDTGASCG